MGRIQEMRMEKAKRAFKEEMFPRDRERAFFVDFAGNAIGFAIERADGNVLFYNAETGHYKPNQQNFEILPEDKVVNVPPFEYKDGKIVATEMEDKPSLDVLVSDAEKQTLVLSSGEGVRKVAPSR